MSFKVSLKVPSYSKRNGGGETSISIVKSVETFEEAVLACAPHRDVKASDFIKVTNKGWKYTWNSSFGRKTLSILEFSIKTK